MAQFLRPTGIRDTIAYFLLTNPVSKALFGANRSIIFNRTVGRKLIRYFNGNFGHNVNSRTGSLGYGFLHYGFITNIKPKTVLCVGSKKGFIPAICALACAENGKGHVDFVDAGYGMENENNWYGEAWWKRTDPQRHFSLLDTNRHISVFIMTTADFSRKFPKKRYDYIYIDGDHSYEGAFADYKRFWPKLNRHGIMAFHDIMADGSFNGIPFGVKKLWNSLDGNKITFFHPDNSGLGFIQKR